MDVLVPFDPEEPKTRLSPVFTATERAEFARAMLDDVVDAVQETGVRPTVLSTQEIAVEDAAVRVDDRPLAVAVNAALDDCALPAAVVMADLPLVTPDALTRLFDASGDVVLARGVGGGTNALVTRDPGFGVTYHGTSFQDNVQRASDCGAAVETVDSFALGIDIDEPSDVPEVLLHSDGAASDWLQRAGVDITVSDGRVSPTRTHDGLQTPTQ